jgi:NADH-quinone oxidoreductase subunit J
MDWNTKLMNLAAAFFYLFSAIMIASAFIVIVARNPVHSVLFLILAFVNAAGLFMIAGAEFLAMILIVVYVGAVAVLFLFVVMMLDVDFAELKEGFLQYLPIGSLIGIGVLIELVRRLSHPISRTPPRSARSSTRSIFISSRRPALSCSPP